MEYIVFIGLCVLFVILFSLNILQDFITELDLKPSLTQFLMVAIFTPLLLISMQSYSKYDQQQNNLRSDMELTREKIRELNLKVHDINNTISILQRWSKNPEIINKNIFKLNHQVDELNSGIFDYVKIYNKLMSNESQKAMSDHYFVNYDNQRRILKSILDFTDPQQKNISSFDILRIESFYERFMKVFKIIDQKEVDNYYDFQYKIIVQNKIQVIYSTISSSFAIFLVFIYLLKAIYIENIVLNKLKKIKDEPLLSADERVVLIKIKKIIEKRIQNRNLFIKYFFYVFSNIELLLLDKKLSSVIDNHERITGKQICNKLLNLTDHKE